jgi:hypothetical protein
MIDGLQLNVNTVLLALVLTLLWSLHRIVVKTSKD